MSNESTPIEQSPFLISNELRKKLDFDLAELQTRQRNNAAPYYQKFVENLFKKMEPMQNMVHASMGISGEAGEVLDLVKKNWAYEKPVDHEKLIEELGDLLFYVQAMLSEMGVDSKQVIAQNVKKLEKRYTDGHFSMTQANARADKADNVTELHVDLDAVDREINDTDEKGLDSDDLEKNEREKDNDRPTEK